MYRLGIDIGGTFTDFVLLNEQGEINLAKVRSTPGSVNFMHDGLKVLCHNLNITTDELLQRLDMIIHGMTVSTNTIIQQRWADTWLMTTRGFRDFLEARLGWKPKRYDYFWRYPPVIVPRYKRLPVSERTRANGEIWEPINTTDVMDNIEKMRKAGAEACAICFLHAYANPTHEREAAELIKEELPEVEISISSDVLPIHREYQRGSTTVLNASLKTSVSKYVEDLGKALRTLGFTGEVRYVQSNGGLGSGEFLADMPIYALNSGPAMGPEAGLFFASLFNRDTLLICDMGGTSFDVSFVQEGSIPMVKDVDVCGYRVAIPMVDVTTLGAGGGSIAWIDDSGRLRVGPKSAEAEPGPACYPQGGQEPTVTDANLCLGLLPNGLAGGMELDRLRAEQIIQQKIASPLGLTLYEAAQGIIDIVNSNMVNGCEAITIGKGYNVRDTVLVTGGGCTPAHAYDIANALGIKEVIIPKIGGVLCAFGAVVANSKRDYIRAYLTKLGEADIGWMNVTYRELEEKAFADLKKDKIQREKIQIVRTIELRYEGQSHELTVNVPPGEIRAETLAAIRELFHKEHEKFFTFRDMVSPCHIVSLGVVGYGQVMKPSVTRDTRGNGDASSAQKGSRLTLFRGYKESRETPVFDGGQLKCGHIINGPAIVEEETTTIVVPPGSTLELTEYQAYLLHIQ
ncbi:hydantoinase/oxoprolinase family protein [Chloroflexota bacterium]